MSRWKESVPRLAAESVVVIVSVLLALLADEWRGARDDRLSAERHVEQIRSELEQNRDRLVDVQAYHAALSDTLLLVAREGSEVSLDVRPRGWLVTPELTGSAWEAANASGSRADLISEMLPGLAEVYHEQAQYLSRREAIMPVLYEAMLEQGSAELSGMPAPLAAIIGDVAAWERRVLDRYDRVLDGGRP